MTATSDDDFSGQEIDSPKHFGYFFDLSGWGDLQGMATLDARGSGLMSKCNVNYTAEENSNYKE